MFAPLPFRGTTRSFNHHLREHPVSALAPTGFSGNLLTSQGSVQMSLWFGSIIVTRKGSGVCIPDRAQLPCFWGKIDLGQDVSSVTCPPNEETLVSLLCESVSSWNGDYTGSFPILYLKKQNPKGIKLLSQRENINHFVVIQSLTRLRLFATPWTAAHQASLPFTVFRSLLKLMSIESMMSSNHLILCRPLFLLPSIFPSIRVFSNESVLLIRWPKHWSFSFSISPSNGYSRLISFRTDWCEP